MNEKTKSEFVVEPERYELASRPAYLFEIERRDFFRVMGAGIAIFLVLHDSEALQESGRRRGGFREDMPKEIGAWLHIGEKGEVTVFTGKAEVGQNIRTSLTQAVAEELRVEPASIRLVMGDTDLTPFDMGTFGSRTTPIMNKQLRKVASAAHDLLIELAAKRLNAKSLKAAGGKITDVASGRTVTYAELAQGRALAKALAENDPLTPAVEWRVAGKPLPKVDGVGFVTGRHRYASDIVRPGMLHGKVLRPAAFGATLASLDASAAEAMPDVTVVHDGDFVGVAAPSASAAERALAAIHAEWKTTPQPSDKELFEHLKANEEKGEGRGDFTAGSVEHGLAAAAHRSEQTYTVAYIAHTPLEPRAAVAEWKDGKLTAWTGSQRPFGVKGDLIQAFRLPEDKVRVIVPDTGSAYGGKHTGETAIEAARLAKAAGRPVKVVWTREEEFTWAYVRPAGVIEVKSGVASDGTLTAWEFHNYNSGGSAIRTPYEVPNQLIQFHPTRSPLRQGSYRGLAATANHFARESHMDELAHAAKIDPLEFRLKNLKDDRLRAVFNAAAEKFGWGRAAKTSGHGFGIAGGVEKGGYVATFAEVAVDRASSAVRVVRVVTAFECGAVVNPNGLANQIEGSNIMGLGGALFEAILFSDGHVTNPRLSQYRVPRFSDLPEIEVVLVDRKDLPSAGAGETPIVGIAPAIGNAIFDATGVRLRSLPMVPNGLKG
jgi:CO/xanthine dehydrogenase Mo-binding subunit